MAEVTVDISERTKKSFESAGISLSEFLKRAAESKEFELEFKRSKQLQRAVIESLSAKSKLTEEGAAELGRSIDESALERLKERGLM